MNQIEKILEGIFMVNICQCGHFAYGGLCWDCFQYGNYSGVELRWVQKNISRKLLLTGLGFC